jgi:hypothetical protein
MTFTISELKLAHPRYFAKGNAKFFGDVGYRILHSKHGAPYMVRKTYAFTDMFDGVRKPHWRVNPIGANLAILPLVGESFDSLQAVKAWLTKVKL